jgi:protein-disulfide isomerase
MSDKREREKRREERVQTESQVNSEDRRKKLLQLGAGAVFLVVVVVAALIVVNASSSDGGDAGNVKDVAVVDEELAGIPQDGLVLGDPKAPVEVIEFGDLQCPICKGYSENILPQVIEGPVADGQAKIAFHNFVVISEESEPAGAAALAAGAQGRGWNFVDLFYRNQGKEASGYVTDAFLTAIAEGAGVEDVAQWNKDRKSAKFTAEVKKTTEEAQQLGYTGTPSFGIKGPGTKGFEVIEVVDPEDLEAAIEAAS